MTVDRYLRMIAGALIVVSLGLSQYVDPRWMYFTVFIGLNLLQSAFSNWCPMMTILKKLGARSA